MSCFSDNSSSQFLNLNFVKVLIAGVLYFSRMSNRFVFYSGTIGSSHSITSCYVFLFLSWKSMRILTSYEHYCAYNSPYSYLQANVFFFKFIHVWTRWDHEKREYLWDAQVISTGNKCLEILQRINSTYFSKKILGIKNNTS